MCTHAVQGACSYTLTIYSCIQRKHGGCVSLFLVACLHLMTTLTDAQLYHCRGGWLEISQRLAPSPGVPTMTTPNFQLECGWRGGLTRVQPPHNACLRPEIVSAAHQALLLWQSSPPYFPCSRHINKKFCRHPCTHKHETNTAHSCTVCHPHSPPAVLNKDLEAVWNRLPCKQNSNC